MSANALFARVKRAAPASLVLASVVIAAPADGQQAKPAQHAATASPAAVDNAEPAPIVRRIVVLGTQRIEPATVLTYLTLHEGDPYDPQAADRALKALLATGLFSDVKTDWDGTTFTIHVVENPIINQVEFEGNSKVTTKDLTKEVQLKPRMVFTRAKVQSDIQRIIELYRRNGKFGATVNPEIIQRPQNRVDLIYSINEGPTTGVARILFVGNHAFDDSTLREQIATEESRWWRILATNDNYDPDRLLFDREQLRRFYVSHGYADFKVTSAVAELTPDRSAFYITFTVDEGPKYNFGNVEIDSHVKELPAQALRPLVPIAPGTLYDEDEVEKAKDTLVNAVGTKGYASAEVGVRLRRNDANHTVDVIMRVEQGPRVYIDKVNIVGNTRTLDKVIRRQLRFAEGDAFNRDLIDRSRTRIRALGFFKDVTIKNSQGSRPDKTDVTVEVTEQSTGEISLGAGYSSTSSFVGEFAYTERNLFGRGQYMRASIAMSTLSKQFQFSFVEPWFLNRPLAAGFDIYKYVTDYNQAGYQGDVSAIGLHVGFPTSEYGSVGVRYTFRINKVSAYSNAPASLQYEILYGGAANTTASEFGVNFGYNTLDDNIKPTRGILFSLDQDFAGFGGSLKFLKTEGSLSAFHKLWGDWVGQFTAQSGFIQAYGGTYVPIEERFFKGGDSFRGFKVAGIGPRDTDVAGDYGAVGGDFYAIGTLQTRIPDFLPADYGMSFALFSDFGTLGHLDSPLRGCATSNYCIKDNLALRASAGVSIKWKSPFGPVQIDLGIPLVKAPYDKAQIFHFSAGTGF